MEERRSISKNVVTRVKQFEKGQTLENKDVARVTETLSDKARERSPVKREPSPIKQRTFQLFNANSRERRRGRNRRIREDVGTRRWNVKQVEQGKRVSVATPSTALSVNDVDPRATVSEGYSTLRY